MSVILNKAKDLLGVKRFEVLRFAQDDALNWVLG